MKQSILAVLVLSIASIAAVGRDRHPSSAAPVVTTPYAPGIIYIKLRPGSKALEGYTHVGIVPQSTGVASAFTHILDQLHATATLPFDAEAPNDAITHNLGIDRMYVVYYTNRAIDPRAALTMLESTGQVECGSVRYLFPLSKTPNDQYISQQYALNKMHLFSAWDITTGDNTVLIADVDDGFNMLHEDLMNAIKLGYDVVGKVNASAGEPFQPDNDPSPDDPAATHGSHTSGCIAASGNNSVGIAGAAYGCRLIAIKCAGTDAQNISGGYEGIHYASTHGARVINCSWGGPVSGTDVAFGNTVLQEATARNALVVAAAGNNGTSNDKTAFYPSNGPGVLSVGATDQSDGPAYYSDFGHSVSVFAPGSGILSCTYPGSNVYNAEDGTSFASPLTAGVAGLVVSLHPSWPPQFIARQIIQTCLNNVQPADQYDFWGCVDADSALRAIPAPGLLVTGYSIDGVASDSLRTVGAPHALSVTFKNVTAAGSGITAKLISGTGYSGSGTVATLGSVGLNVTAQGNFQITRNGIFSEGNLPIRFFLTDGGDYHDTMTMYIPLTRVPGFRVEQVAPAGSSLKRTSHTAAWASFGNESTTGGVAIADYARETAGAWSDTAAVWDRSQAPYDVEAFDSTTAWFGTGPQGGGPASVLWTTDGGKTFGQSDVSSFTAFVNTIHFFAPKNGVPMDGILIGDPASTTSINSWGIGISSDGGKTWDLSPTAPDNMKSGEASWNNATAWVGDYGWFGSNSSRIWHTSDRGKTWTPASTNYPNSLSLAMDDDTLHGFACFRKVTSASGTSGVNGMQKTTNGGITWTSMPMPVAKMIPGAVAFVPNSNMGIVTSDSGVFRTTDFGATWSPIGFPIGYDAASAEVLSVYRGQGKLTLSMISSGTGVATYSESMAEQLPPASVEPNSQPLAFSIAPNPCEQNAEITFDLPERQQVRLVVLDALGREVAVLLNGIETGPGAQTVNFHSTPLADGVYYVMLTTDRGIKLTRAISVIR
ncbi:MAG: S8 family serine peptidase [Bacteroidota bacterium]|nr:S8 family serine peptidase [Bacteroidota bacterium]MDP4232944.1 S8 family serine peptidase [Bacteroidota bacterium]MDP4286891.1 S8 family serine peptidase [Bacteroidota bacterium]